jgi:hypothetical protein
MNYASEVEKSMSFEKLEDKVENPKNVSAKTMSFTW